MENIIASALLILRLLMAFALYAFLAWAMITMWRDVSKPILLSDAQQAPSIQLSQLGQNASKHENFHTTEISIGRNPGNNWVLDHDTVSSRHARIIFHRTQWWLEDLDSKNGSFLNGEQFKEPMVLNDKDQVSCGQAQFSVSL
jgi:pSer/pThr/pTyr-binding forkhead associated (FHA) protein